MVLLRNSLSLSRRLHARLEPASPFEVLGIIAWLMLNGIAAEAGTGINVDRGDAVLARCGRCLESVMVAAYAGAAKVLPNEGVSLHGLTWRNLRRSAIECREDATDQLRSHVMKAIKLGFEIRTRDGVRRLKRREQLSRFTPAKLRVYPI